MASAPPVYLSQLTLQLGAGTLVKQAGAEASASPLAGTRSGFCNLRVSPARVLDRLTFAGRIWANLVTHQRNSTGKRLAATWPARDHASVMAGASGEAEVQGSVPFEVTPLRGFLPQMDPIRRLASLRYSAWEDTLLELPQLLVASGEGRLRDRLESLPEFNAAPLVEEGDEQQLWRAHLVLSFLAHAYMWGDDAPPPSILPSRIAVPWCTISKRLDVPPVLTYATYNLLNWRRLDPSKPVELGNIVCLHNFAGGVDEEWFRLVHVEIEARAAVAVEAIQRAQRAVAAGEAQQVEIFLREMTATLCSMQSSLSRMGERCDPYIYYHRIRSYMSGWRDNPALSSGLVYEGVAEEPQMFYGETGAQSSIIPAFDAALGVVHPYGWLSDYLKVMRSHMPRTHRAFLKRVEEGPSIREFAKGQGKELCTAYDDCLSELFKFRSMHKSFAYNYIKKHSPKADERGTGGTDFMPYLAKHAQTTSEHLLGLASHK